MAAVVTHRFRQTELLVGESGMVVDINYRVSCGIFFQAVVDSHDGLPDILNCWSPRKRLAWRYRADNRDDAVGFGDVAHGFDVFDDLLGRHPIVVVCHVVGASRDDYRLRTKRHHIIGKPHKHLSRGLSADASSAEMIVSEEVRMKISPELGYRIANKNHLRIILCGYNLLVVGLVNVRTEPVLRETKNRHGHQNDYDR